MGGGGVVSTRDAVHLAFVGVGCCWPDGAVGDLSGTVLMFKVVCEPQTKERVRFGAGRTYTRAKTVAYEKGVRRAVEAALLVYSGGQEFPIQGAVGITLEFIRVPPKRWPKKRLWPWWSTVPDFDNLTKAVADAMNKVVWEDDSRIVLSAQMKRYAMPGEEPGVVVTVWEVAENDEWGDAVERLHNLSGRGVAWRSDAGGGGGADGVVVAGGAA